MNKRAALIIVLLIVAAILVFPLFRQGAENTPDFVEQAALSNMFEVQSSEVALNSAQSEDVRRFAEMMVQEHRQVGDRLRETVSTANVDVQPPQALDDDHQERLEDLRSADPAEFDEQYLDAQMEAHENAISLFEGYAENGENMELRQFASQVLPSLQQHQNELQQIQEQQQAEGEQQAQGEPQAPEASETTGALQN